MKHTKNFSPFYALFVLFTLAFFMQTAHAAPNEFALLGNGSFEEGEFGENWAWWNSNACGGGATFTVDQNAAEAAVGNYFVDVDHGTNGCGYLVYEIPFDINTLFNVRVRKTEGVEQSLGISTFTSLSTENDGTIIAGAGQGLADDCNVTKIEAPNDNNKYTANGQVFQCDFHGGKYLVFDTGDWANNENGRIDYILFKSFGKLTNTIIEENGDPVQDLIDFNIAVEVRDEDNDLAEDVNAEINFDGEGFIQMTATGTGRYEVTLNKGVGSYAYTIRSIKTDHSSDTDTGSIEVRQFVNFSEAIEFTAIENIGSSQLNSSTARNGLDLRPTDKDSVLIYKLKSISDQSINLRTAIFNTLNDGWQYKIYTATDSDHNAGIWNFNDTLTFGSSMSNSVQKVWRKEAGLFQFEHSFSDIIGAGETIYYRIEYYKPFIYFNSILDRVGWNNQLTPHVSDVNGLPMDLFETSFYSSAKSILTNPFFPGITSGVSPINYVFQLTAASDSAGTGKLAMGTSGELFEGAFRHDLIDVNKGFKTYTTTDLNNGFARFDMNSTTSKEFLSYNYAVTERGFFTKSLDLFEIDGSQLPAILLSDNSEQYIREGENFIVDTEYRDQNGAIDFIEVSAYVDVVQDGNRLKKWRFDAPDGQIDPIQFREEIGGIVDLIADAPNRTIKVTVRLADTNSNTYEIQSKAVKLLQYPFFPEDIRITASMFSNSIGSTLSGQVFLTTRRPETVKGVYIAAYKSSGRDANQSDFNKMLLKDEFFSCNIVGNCGFLFNFEEWVFETAGAYTIAFMADVTTEKMNTSNEKISFILNKNFDPIGWETSSLVETFVRADQNYRNDETTMFALKLRDNLNSPLKNEIDPLLMIQDCGLTISCTDGGDGETIKESVKYPRSLYTYDQNTGINWYFYRNLLLEDFGQLLEDKHFYQLGIEINDQKGRHASLLSTDLNLNRTGGVIQIEAAKDVNAPAFAGVFTLQDNILETIGTGFDKPQQRPKPFMAKYKLGEQQIDAFMVTIGNQFSDYTEDREEFQQFIKARIDWRDLFFNDQVTARNKGAEFLASFGSTLLGGLSVMGAFLGTLIGATNPVMGIITSITSTSLISVGQADFNALADLVGDEREILIVVKNLDIVNRQDYPITADIPMNKTMEWIIKNKRKINKGTAIIEFWQNGIKVSEQQVPNKLVDSFNKNEIKAQADVNATAAFITTNVDFHFDMIYNSGLNAKRLTISRPVKAKIDFTENLLDSMIQFGEKLTTDPIGALFDFALANPIMFAFIIFLIIIAAIVVVIIRGRGG